VPQAVGTIPGSGQASHVLQVAGSVALDSWKLLLEVCAEAVDDPGTPAFGLLADQDLAPDRDIQTKAAARPHAESAHAPEFQFACRGRPPTSEERH
jgi:hypothetical protein